MSGARLDDVFSPRMAQGAEERRSSSPGSTSAEPQRGQRIERRGRTPRTSLIVVLPDNHVVSPDQLAERLPADDASQTIDVIVACAGQPVNLTALQRRVRDVQFLLAPAGTSPEDLRELAMRQAPGDIVSLLCGVALSTMAGDREICAR